jgi:hypothetical protein
MTINVKKVVPWAAPHAKGRCRCCIDKNKDAEKACKSEKILKLQNLGLGASDQFIPFSCFWFCRTIDLGQALN